MSCTPGAWPIPGSNLVMPLAFDACSDLYFFSPFSSQFFNLTPSGLADILPATGAQGTVTLPVLTPSGLNIDLHVSFRRRSAARKEGCREHERGTNALRSCPSGAARRCAP